MDLKVGDLVDFWRAPYTKDVSGWLGPAKVVDTTEIGKGSVGIKWQRHIYISS